MSTSPASVFEEKKKKMHPRNSGLVILSTVTLWYLNGPSFWLFLLASAALIREVIFNQVIPSMIFIIPV